MWINFLLKERHIFSKKEMNKVLNLLMSSLLSACPEPLLTFSESIFKCQRGMFSATQENSSFVRFNLRDLFFVKPRTKECGFLTSASLRTCGNTASLCALCESTVSLWLLFGFTSGSAHSARVRRGAGITSSRHACGFSHCGPLGQSSLLVSRGPLLSGSPHSHPMPALHPPRALSPPWVSLS